MSVLQFDFDTSKPLRPAQSGSPVYSFFCGTHGRVCWSNECDALPKEERKAPGPVDWQKERSTLVNTVAQLAVDYGREQWRNLHLTQAWEQLFHKLHGRFPNASEYP